MPQSWARRDGAQASPCPLQLHTASCPGLDGDCLSSLWAALPAWGLWAPSWECPERESCKGETGRRETGEQDTRNRAVRLSTCPLQSHRVAQLSWLCARQGASVTSHPKHRSVNSWTASHPQQRQERLDHVLISWFLVRAMLMPRPQAPRRVPGSTWGRKLD